MTDKERLAALLDGRRLCEIRVYKNTDGSFAYSHSGMLPMEDALGVIHKQFPALSPAALEQENARLRAALGDAVKLSSNERRTIQVMIGRYRQTANRKKRDGENAISHYIRAARAMEKLLALESILTKLKALHNPTEAK